MAATEDMIVRMCRTEDFDGVYNYIQNSGNKLDPTEVSQTLEIALPIKEQFLRKAIRRYCAHFALVSVVPFLNLLFTVYKCPRLEAAVVKYGRQVAVLGHSDQLTPDRIRHVPLLTPAITNLVYLLCLVMCNLFHQSVIVSLVCCFPNILLSGTWGFVWDVNKYLNRVSDQRKCLFSPYNRRWWQLLKTAEAK